MTPRRRTTAPNNAGKDTFFFGGGGGVPGSSVGRAPGTRTSDLEFETRVKFTGTVGIGSHLTSPI